MKDIFNRCLNKINKNIDEIFFMCNGSKIDGERKLEEINNNDNEMTILVYDINNKNNENKGIVKQSKDIICAECGEICLLDIKDYKITLNHCNNKHKRENILLDEYENLQQIKEINIICNECNKNKNDVFQNKFYKCCNCKTNICPICKSKHNKEHKLIDYELKNYLCNIHGERYMSFCKDCYTNLCDICEVEHNKKYNSHNYEYLTKLMKNEDNNNIKELRIKIDNLRNEINDIINRLNKINNNMEIYFKLYNNIINNYDLKNKNYELLINTNNISNYNKIIIKDINEIINENKIENKMKYLYDIYDKMITINEIVIKYKIGKENRIRVFGDTFVENNKSNFKMVIDNKDYEIDSFYNVENKRESDILEIKLKQINNVTNLSFMFNECISLIELPDISKLDTSDINTMENMFSECSSLLSLPDISKWNTNNVKNMAGSFNYVPH